MYAEWLENNGVKWMSGPPIFFRFSASLSPILRQPHKMHCYCTFTGSPYLSCGMDKAVERRRRMLYGEYRSKTKRNKRQAKFSPNTAK